MSRPSISFNLLALDTRQPVGVERFARDVLSGVQLPGYSVTCYTRKHINKLTDLFNPAFTSSHSQVTRKRFWTGSTITRILIEMLVLPFLTRKDDTVVSINNFGPVWGKRGQSRLVFVHDVWFMSDWYEGGAIKKWLFTCLLRLQIRRSSKIITVSEFSRRDISKYLNIPAHKIDLISNCIAREIPVTRPPKSDNANYLLLVGSERKNKNILRAIAGYRIFVEANPKLSTRMIVVGKYSAAFTENIRKSFPSIWDHLDIQGFVDDTSLDRLYRGCRGVIFPSLYEGFGIPAVEALMYGRPVLVADNTACSEIVGNFAVQVDGKDPSSIAKGIGKLLNASPDFSSTSYLHFRTECMDCQRQSDRLTRLIQRSI